MNFVKRLTSYSRQATRFHAVFVGACVLGCASTVLAADAQSAKTNAPAPKTAAAVSAPAETYQNSVGLSLGGTIVDGDKGAFSQRQQVPAGEFFGGVDTLHYQDAVDKDTTLTIDGRGIIDNHDYLLDLNLVNPDVGFVKAGYEEFRTWYDASAGYLPVQDLWLAPDEEALALDRGTFWVEGGLTQPDLPQLTLRYEHQFRDGKKDSTSWGDETTKNIRRNIVPTIANISEQRNILTGDGKQTFGNTELALGLRYEFEDDNLDDSSDVTRSALTSVERVVLTESQQDTDLFDAHASTDTILSKKVRFTTGYLFSSLDTDITGTRIFGADSDATFDPLFKKNQFHDEGYYDLVGGSREKQFAMNANLMLNPADNITITPSAKIEKRTTTGDSRFAETAVNSNLVADVEDVQAFNERGIVEASEQLEARFTGIRDWVLYASGDWTEGDGDYSNHTEEYETKEITDAGVDADDTRFMQKYTAGATWYPTKGLNFGSQYYHKILENDYDDYSVLSSLSSDTDDLNVRATWRPANTLTLVARQDAQLSTVNQASETESGDHQSADITRYISSGTLTWTPMASLYLQTGLNYARDRMETPAVDVTGAGANIVTESLNDYWNFSQLVGMAVADETDLQLRYSYYRADDFLDNSAYSTPYGAGVVENTLTATLKHNLSSGMQVALKYGYFVNRDDASGGNNDYDAHLIMTSMNYRF